VEGLLGRDAELRRLDELVAAARQGMSGVLVLRGEPGVGKTALLDHAQAVAADLQVVRIDCVESEMELSFAAVHQLLRPFLADLDGLPAPQRAALRVAFGMTAGGPPDRFLAGLAALGLLTGQAVRQPLLCLVDDAHCLDQESAGTLAFVARRLHADAIALVFAVREPTPPPGRLTGLPELRLAGLATAEARALLATAAGPGLRPPVAGRRSPTGSSRRPAATRWPSSRSARNWPAATWTATRSCPNRCRSAASWNSVTCGRSGPCPPPRRPCC
jgi:AAA ATPase domain